MWFFSFTESGGTSNARVLAIVCEQQWYVQRGRVDACTAPAFANLIEKGREQGRNPTAHHNDVRFQEIDDVSEPVCQQIQSLAHHFLGGRIARSMSPPALGGEARGIRGVEVVLALVS